MNSVYLVLALSVCVFGLLFWLTRKCKREGVLETEKSALEQTVKAVGKANAIENEVDRMSDDVVADELSKRTTR